MDLLGSENNNSGNGSGTSYLKNSFSIGFVVLLALGLGASGVVAQKAWNLEVMVLKCLLVL